MKILYESDGGGFDGGLSFYPPNPYDFEQPSFGKSQKQDPVIVCIPLASISKKYVR